MKTVQEVSRITGISVRTLHYYHEIGLLEPEKIGYNGYRYYGDSSLAKLQEILFFRELGFTLKEIRKITQDPGYDKAEALNNHINLLELKKQRLNRLIDLARATLRGENIMEFKAFDDKEIKATKEKYKTETKERWGSTSAYKESQEKENSYTPEQWEAIHREMDEIMAGFAKNAQADPADPQVQDLVKQWQQHLTKYYYEATNEILKSLGQMYVADQRFTANIDKYGEGTAKIMSQAIACYVAGSPQ